MEEHNFDYGDEVEIIKTAPDKYHPGEPGAVVGFIQINNDYLLLKYNEEFGTILCSVEFGDGTTIEIPEKYLVKLDV